MVQVCIRGLKAVADTSQAWLFLRLYNQLIPLYPEMYVI
jgi:hypothetical protein